MRRTLVLAAAGVAAITCCGIAVAAVALPFSGDGNTINGCYSSKGTLTVLTPSEATCPKKSEPIQWNVTGPPGTPGADGANGVDGAPGVSPTVTALAEGDANCPTGGAAITDANGSTAYVCSGANGADGQDGEPFSGTFTSGQYSLSVTDDGITLAGPLSTTIVLDATGVTMESANPVTIKSATSLTVRGTAVSLKGDASLTAEASGTAEVKGALVRINGGAGCNPAARLGDQIFGTATGSAVSGQIITGASTVCIG